MLGKLQPIRRGPASDLRNPQDVTLTVTDMFWMGEDQLCVAGELADGTVVRLRAGADGPNGAWMEAATGGVLSIFQELRLRIGDPPPDTRPPFTEERAVAASGHRILRELTVPEAMAMLEKTCSPGVRDIFGATLHVDAGSGREWYVRAGEGERSLGTVKAAQVQTVTARRNRDLGLFEFRLSFQDARGEQYKLTIADATVDSNFRILGEVGLTPQEAARSMAQTLRAVRTIYLRIGLIRPTSGRPDRCSVQVAGILSDDDGASGPPAGNAWNASALMR